MNSIFNTLSRKKLQLFFLFYVLLVLPLLSPIAQNISAIESAFIILVNILMAASIAIFASFFNSKVEKTIYSIVLLLCLVPGAILLTYLLTADVLLQQNSIISLFETNPEESKEVVVYYLNTWLVIGMLIYALSPVWMIFKMKKFSPLKIREHKLVFGLSVAVLAAVIFIPQVSRLVYSANFYKEFITYKLRLAHEESAIAERQLINYPVSLDTNDTIPKTIVVVIGESLNRHHMGLYGYARNTNPLLSQYSSNFHIYSDVVSPQVHTIPVIRSVLSLSDRNNADSFTEKPSLFELFNRAGFETYFVSNQGFGASHKTSYDVLLNLAKHKYDLSPQKKNDEVVFSVLDEILQDKSVKNKLIVVHLIGNHMAYEFRYPKTFELFDNTKDKLVEDSEFRNSQAKKVMDRYDNSVAYNDFIVASIIEKLGKKPKAAMIYFSDHGEELYTSRDFAGHAYEKVSTYMAEVPFLVWTSDAYQHSDLIFDTNRAYSTTDFVYSLSNLAGLNFKDYDATKSIFSKDFESSVRFVGDIDYEELKLMPHSKK